jgi:hypothetical protein
MLNFFGYPDIVDGKTKTTIDMRDMLRHLVDNAKACATFAPLRRLMIQSMVHDGTFATTKHYLQPLINTSIALIPFALGLADKKRTAILAGAVYTVLHLVESFSSAHSHSLVKATGSEQNACKTLWIVELCAYALCASMLLFGYTVIAMMLFIILAASTNFWRPAFFSRLDMSSSPQAATTILSIDAQAESVFVLLMAPLVGFAVDKMGIGVGMIFPIVPLLVAMPLVFRREKNNV